MGTCHVAGPFPFRWVVLATPRSIRPAKLEWTLRKDVDLSSSVLSAHVYMHIYVCVCTEGCLYTGVFESGPRTSWAPCPLFPFSALSYPQPLLGQTGLPQGPSEQKVAVVTVDGCDTGVALRFGAVLGNYSCAAQGTQGGSKK